MKEKCCLKLKTVLKMFFFFAAYECIVPGACQLWQSGEFNYANHAVDFSVGFCSRILPGAIVNYIFKEINQEKFSVFESIFLLILLFFVSVMLCFFLNRVPGSEKSSMMFLVFLFMVGPCTFSIYVQALGMFDVYWLFLAVLCVFCLSNKKLWWLCVPAVVTMIIVYYASIMCFVPAVVILLLYKGSCEEKKEDRYYLYTLAFFASVTAIGLTIYFLLTWTSNVKISREAFDALVESRGVSFKESLYIAFFRDYGDNNSGELKAALDSLHISESHPLLYFFAGMVVVVFLKSGTNYFNVLAAALLIAPVVWFMLSFFVSKRKCANNKMKSFSLFCMSIIFFFVVCIGMVVSTDGIKWIAHGYFLTFALFLYVLYQESCEMKVISDKLRKIPRSVLVIYALIYMLTSFHPYF